MSADNLPKTIFIGGISKSVNEDDLRDAFKGIGSIINVKPKGEFAFIEFDHTDDADAAVKEMNGRRICGYTITVQKSYGGRKERTMRGGGEGDVCFNCGDKGHW